jgi:hypothetical protein
MKNDKSKLMRFFSVLAIVGNYLFILWILYYAISQGFKEMTIGKFSYFTLIVLLAVNASLLINNSWQPKNDDTDDMDE